jgi:serine phosphatase RsbU (regulator of sigma subunit)/tetratricopeptide (TPR) repeat protein
MDSVAQSDYYIDSIIVSLKTSIEDTNKLISLSIVAENASDDIWPVYNNEMGKLAAKLQNSPNIKTKLCAKRHLAASLNNKGFFFTERGISYKAILYFNKALKIQQEIRDLEGEAYSLSNLGAIYDSKGEIDKALEYYFAAVKIRENLNSKLSLAQSYNNIAVLYNNQNDLVNALKYHFHSLRIREQINNPSGIALAYNNIGTTYTSLVENEFKGKKPIPDSLIKKSYEYFNKSYLAYQKDNNEHGMGHSMFNLADLYILQADCYHKKNSIEYDTLVNKAEILFLRCYDIYVKTNEKEWLANTLNGLTNVYWRQNKNQKAQLSGEKAMAISQELGYPGTIQKSADILRLVYQSNHSFEKALQMSDLYHSMRDSVVNEKNQKDALSKYFLYQSEKQEMLTKAHQEKMGLEFSAKTKQQSIVIYFGISGLILLAVFGVFMYNRYKLTQKQNEIIQQQKSIVEESRKEIVDSINYAKKIQYALLANKELLDKNLESYFVLFNPKDIVSGDFYWATEDEDNFYIAVCDSTGHGVPGAFMSLLSIGFLSEAIKEKNIKEPNKVFDYVRKRLIESITNENQKDGFDGILLRFDRKTNEISYAASNNRPVFVSNNKIEYLNCDKMPVGKGERDEKFSLYTIPVSKGDIIYLYTDGYADQFGGVKGKKFKYKPLNELLVSVNQLDLDAQREILNTTFEKWKGNLEQVDDVCIMGIQI